MEADKQPVHLQSDDDVMVEVREGDVNTLAVLFERHHRMLFHFFMRLTGSRQAAEDLVQEVFLRILKYRQTYQVGNQFAAWMYQIARNSHLDWIRKRKVETLFDSDGEERHTQARSSDPIADAVMERRQEVELLKRALAALPVEKRELLILARFQNLKYEDIAKVLDCEVGAVKVRVHRAVRELGKVYMEISGEKAS